MTEAFGPIVYLVALVAIAAALLWIVERIAKLIGARNTWLLFLCVIPLLFSVAYSIHNWSHFTWWQKVAYPLAGPVLAGMLLLLGFAAVNPVDAVRLPFELLRAAWRHARSHSRAARVTPNTSLERTREE